MTAGGSGLDNMLICPLASVQENFGNLPENVPAVMARKTGGDHDNTVEEAKGYITAWFCYWLKGDSAAAGFFAGDDPELLKNTGRWQDAAIKGFWYKNDPDGFKGICKKQVPFSNYMGYNAKEPEN